jgi:hypothetical protein
MDIRDRIILDGLDYQILYCEYDNIFHPEIFDIKPTWENDANFMYYCNYELVDFQLLLRDFTVSCDRGYPEVNGVKPEYCLSDSELDVVVYKNIMESISFTGAMIIGDSIVKNYGNDVVTPCYCYKSVRELIFLNGKLITSIDHSKAMVRVRRNIELGLRNPEKKRDVKCINHFLKSSFAGDYEHPRRRRYVRSKPSIKKSLQSIKNQYIKGKTILISRRRPNI